MAASFSTVGAPVSTPTSFLGKKLKKQVTSAVNYNGKSFKANRFTVMAKDLDEGKQTDQDKWKGLAYDISDDQQDITRGKGIVDALFQAPMGDGTHEAVLSSYEYLSQGLKQYDFDNTMGGFYIAPAFMDKLVVHLSKNFMTLPNIKIPLILGIWGGKGQGKSFQCELVFAKMGINPIMMSAGELESGNAGEPAKLIRQRYREAADMIKKGKMCCLFINDLDAGAGRMGGTTQYTVNNQMVNATLMNIADAPTNVQLPGMYNKESRSLSSTSQNRPGEPVTCAASRRVDGLEALIRDKDAPMAQSGSPPPFPTTEMRKKQKQEDEEEQQPLGSLPEGPLVEILSRVPYRSLCRFKCVSKPWLALCSDPQVRKRCPQTLTGFFHHRPHGRLGVNFRNLSGRGPPTVDPSLPFLRKSYELVNPEHCCGGLILCRCWKSGHSGEDEYNLVVCNPATEKWTELPPCPVEWTETNEDEQYLGFDPASPSRFVVFLHLFYSAQVTIYSSDTGRWTVLQSNQPFTVSGFSESVFMKGTMHLSTVKGSIVTVDTEGKVWKEIDIPGNVPTRMQCFSIGQSQGHLYAWCIDDPNVFRLSVWVLEDYDRAKWTLKHSVNILELFGRHSCKYDEFYEMFAIHPDRNLIFLTNGKKTISYDMDNREVHDMDIAKTLCRVQPYIPCFADCLSDGH